MKSEHKQKNIEKRVEIPEKADADADNNFIKIRGPKGEVEKNFRDPRFVRTIFIEKSGNEIIVSAKSNDRKVRSMCGTIEAHIKNMLAGVTKGYAYTLKIFYTHFPVSLTIKGGEVQIRNFLGEKGARIAKISGDAQVKLEKDEVIVTGASIEDVSQTAANIEQACRISKRDRRVFQDGIYVQSKALETGERI